MKIDRLLGITMHLLNRDVVTSRELCDKFEVSQRTIVRDIETLNMAGIPVSSSPGSKGGYEILDTFKLNKQITNVDDYLFIITALKGLCSAVDSNRLNETLEKLLAVGSPVHNPKFILDFSVVKEDKRINDLVKVLEDAILEYKIIMFDYTKADGGTNLRTVEPLALTYKWYAWYLFGYCDYKKDYRLFKLKRMHNLTETGQCYQNRHGDAAALIDMSERNDNRHHFVYTLRCKGDALVLVMEYLGGEIIEEYDNGDFLLSMMAVDNDRLWFSLLLGFGDLVEVVEPDFLREQLKAAGEKIANLY